MALPPARITPVNADPILTPYYLGVRGYWVSIDNPRLSGEHVPDVGEHVQEVGITPPERGARLIGVDDGAVDRITPA